MNLCFLLLGLALADPPEATPAPTPTPVEASEDAGTEDTDLESSGEVLVLSERAVELARDALMVRAQEQGYGKEIRKGDRTLLRHDQPWKGDIVLHDDGRVEVKRQPIQFRPPGKKPTVLGWMSCIIVPLCIRPNGQLVSQRRFIGYERNAWAAISPEVQTFNEAIATYGLESKMAALPESLTALWELGVPLEPDAPTVEGFAARRAIILQYWDSRTDTEWGDAMRGVAEAFCRAVVQTSDDPFTEAELAEFARTKKSSRAFSLSN